MGSANGIRNHERHCTMNPNRQCRMCGGSQKPITELTDASLSGLDALRKAANGCPACILAGIRQRPILPLTPDIWESLDSFKYKDEVEKFWATKNAEYERY